MITPSEILKARILIVDDQEANVSLLEEMLHGAGYSAVTSTRDPHLVGKLHHTHLYDLIMLDLQMPGMDGFQVMQELKAVEPGGCLPVLVITAQPGHKLRALKEGARDFISKPFDLAEVLMRVHNMIEIRLLHRNEILLNEARLENSQHIAGLGDWEHDFVRNTLHWSEEVYRILGISRKDFPPDSATFYRHVHPDDLAFVHQQKKVAAAGAHRIEFEHRIYRPGGEMRYIHQIAGMIFDDQGRPLRESGTLQDITERRRTEETLSESEQRYRVMFEHSPSAMWAFDPQTLEFLAVNDSAIALYGYSRNEFMRMTVKDVLRPELVTNLVEQSNRASEQFQAVGRSLHQRKTGTVFPVDILAHEIDFAGRPAQLVLALDMTESERAIAALRAGEARFRALSESAPLGIFECDAAGQVTYFNPALVALSGRPAGESLGGNWEKNIHPDDRAVLSSHWQRAVAEGSTWDQELRLLRPDDSVRWVHILAAPRLDAKECLTGFVGTVEDITNRRLAEEGLRRSQSLLRMAGRISRMGAWSVKLPENTLTLSDEACLIHDMSPDFAPTVEEAMSFYIPECRGAMTRVFEDCVRDGSSFDIELQIVTVKGRHVWLRSIGEAERDVAGVIQRVQGTIQDISDRKENEEALRESEEKFSGAFMDAPIGVALLAPDGRWLKVNRALCNLIGYTEAELLARTFQDVTHSEDLAADLEYVRQLLAGEINSYQMEKRYIHAQGHFITILLNVSLVRDGHGQPLYFISQIQDISARKNSEVALRDSEERFKLVARAVSDVVWDWNISGGTLWWSDGFLTTFGYSAGDIEPGAGFRTMRIHPDERRRIVASIQQAMDTGAEDWSADYRFQRKNGSYAHVHDRGYIIRDVAGLAVRIVGGMRDLTEQKKMEDQYLRAQRMESIGTLAGGIAHDLNNVLAPIMMSIELLKSDSGNDPQAGRILDTVQASCRRGADLVRQVLTFARGVDGERIPIRLRHLIGDLDGIVSETFPPNIRIVTDVPNDLWPVTGDATQIHQVLLNLAVNARDAMPRGGTLTVTASNITFDAQYAGTSPEARSGTYVMLQVADTGEGMSPAVRERIFEPFFTTKEVGKGTGIGLATVHTIIKSHAGFMNVESEVGRGTTFKIFFPADPEHRIAATVHPFQAALPRGRDELVLVADDESSIRQITRQTLEAFGYRVITASDGAEAVALYARQMEEITIVITDMMMPIMDGQATIEVLKRINPAVKIIAASGVDSGANIARATDSGAPDFLPKPFTAETLLRLIREVIDRPALTVAQ